MNKTKQKQTYRHREQTSGCQEEDQETGRIDQGD